MKNIWAVIGANAGDEGKGAQVDYLCSRLGQRLVVRFCGGAQAGHTVVNNSVRFVFHHLGSGTLLGSATYLSPFFICNPILFCREYQDFLDTCKHVVMPHPRVFVDSHCLVTTPYDMILNQTIEHARGENRHGSCGLGVFETVRRAEHGEHKLLVGNLISPDHGRSCLNSIRKEWVPFRLNELGMLDQLAGIQHLLDDDNLVDHYLEDVKVFLQLTERSDTTILKDYDNLVFEGSQGLLLDQDYVEHLGWQPHSTPANTGLKNVVSLLKSTGLEDSQLNAVYLTRPYVTRHGAGPLPHELPQQVPYKSIVDLTNVPNEWQGSIRYGYLDTDSLKERIDCDLKYAAGLKVSKQLAIKCIDHVDSLPILVSDGQRKTLPNTDTLVDRIVERVGGVEWVYYSCGPRGSHVSAVNWT